MHKFLLMNSIHLSTLTKMTRTRLALERGQKRDEAKRTSFKTTAFYNHKFCVVR